MRNFKTWCLGAAALPFLALAPAEAVDFEKEILPIFEAKCIECHKAPYEENGRTKKPKAGLRMDAAWAILAGSENGAVLEAGDPGKSELYYRVTLPEDDDDFMPPTGKADPLSEKELAVFKKWIEEGADFGGWEGNLEGKPKDTSSPSDEPPVSEIQEVYKKLSEGLPVIDKKGYAPVTEAGGRVAPLAQKSPLLSVDFRLASDEVTDEIVAKVEALGSNVANLDLSRTGVTDEALSLVASTPNLVRLNLSQTGIGDAGLKHLSGLKNLRYLNLYGSNVTDAGLKHLHGIDSLTAVYLWQSKATPNGAKQLEKALPNAKVNIK